VESEGKKRWEKGKKITGGEKERRRKEVELFHLFNSTLTTPSS